MHGKVHRSTVDVLIAFVTAPYTKEGPFIRLERPHSVEPKPIQTKQTRKDGSQGPGANLTIEMNVW